MKTKQLAGTKVYWVAQSQLNTVCREVFRTRAEAVRFIESQTDGWTTGTRGNGWTLFQCAAFAEHRP